MKKRLVLLLLTALLCSCSDTGESVSHELILADNSGIPSQIKLNRTYIAAKSDNKTSDEPDKLNFTEQKGVWISYIDLYDMLYNKTEAQFEEAFDNACKNCKNIGTNTLYVHVRAFGDAFYHSSYYQFTKTAGESCDYDPLEIMTAISHKNGLSIHAWINPYRCETPELISGNDDYRISYWYHTDNDRIKLIDSDGHLWLDPAYEDVRQLILDGIAEIIDNYDIDGIHFDDYFYPTTDTWFDSISFENSGQTELSDFRRDNVNKLVKAAYELIKEKNKNILFGISPQGNIDNNINEMYADVYKWCSETGYIDYILPQIYFGFQNPVLPFDECADKWSRLKTNNNVSLVIGLAVYKLYSEDEYQSDSGILAKQIAFAKGVDGYSGYALYNYSSLYPTEPDKAEYAGLVIENIIKEKDGS